MTDKSGPVKLPGPSIPQRELTLSPSEPERHLVLDAGVERQLTFAPSMPKVLPMGPLPSLAKPQKAERKDAWWMTHESARRFSAMRTQQRLEQEGKKEQGQ